MLHSHSAVSRASPPAERSARRYCIFCLQLIHFLSSTDFIQRGQLMLLATFLIEQKYTAFPVYCLYLSVILPLKTVTNRTEILSTDKDSKWSGHIMSNIFIVWYKHLLINHINPCINRNMLQIVPILIRICVCQSRRKFTVRPITYFRQCVCLYQCLYVFSIFATTFKQHSRLFNHRGKNRYYLNFGRMLFYLYVFSIVATLFNLGLSTQMSTKKNCRLEIAYDRLLRSLSIPLLAALGAKLIGPFDGR